jgi:hypothetical protein
MKRILIFTTFLCCFGSSFLFGQLNISHYSFALKGGIDYYFVAPKGNDKFVNAGWTAPGVSLEYTINHLFGIALNYDYLTYNREVGLGNTHDATLVFSYNFLNTFVPIRGGFWFNMDAYLNVGLGGGYYSATVRPENNTLSDFSGVGTIALNLEYNISKPFSFFAEGQYRIYTKNNIGGLPSKSAFNSAIVVSLGVRYKFNAKKNTHIRNINSTFDCCN